MAKELQGASSQTSGTVYARLFNDVGQVWNTVGAAFEAFNAANVTDYDLVATQVSTTGRWTADMPAATVGTYYYDFYLQAGGTAAVGDVAISTGGSIDWTGSAPFAPALRPTTAGRTLDVSAGGEAGVDWANVGTPGSTVNLSATTVNLVNTVTTLTNLPAITANWLTAAGLATDAVDEIVDAVWDELLTVATHNVATSAGRRLRQVSSIISEGATVNDAGATTTTFITTLTSAVDDFYNDELLIFTSGALIGQARPILDYNGTTKAVTLSEALTSAPADGVSFDVQATHIHPTSQIASAVWQDTTAGDFTVASSIGKSLYTSGAVPGAAGGLFIAGSNAATTVNITGNLSGSVGSVTGAVGSVTGNVGGNVTGSVGSLAAQAKTDVNSAVFDVANTIEDMTFRQAFTISAADSAGLSSGNESNAPVIKGMHSSTTRISATTDANGNRTAVTLTLP